MAVQWTASGQGYLSTQGMTGGFNQYTWTCWIRLDSTPGSFTNVVWFESGSRQYVITDGVNIRFQSQGGSTIGQVALTVGVWTPIAVTVNNGTATFYRATSGDVGALTSASGACSNTADHTSLGLGRNSINADWFPGRMASFKLWKNTVLSASQIQAELAQLQPLNATGLDRFYRFATASGTDGGPNGYNLTGSGGSTAADPNIPETGFVTHSAASTFAGAGGLTLAASKIASSAVTLAGAGGLTAAARQGHTAAATFAGSGALAASGTVLRPAAATFAGEGQLTAGGVRVRPAAVTFAGEGGLVATPGQAAAADFAGDGSLTATARQTHQAGAAFAGSGEMSPTGFATGQAAATFAGAGQMLADARPVRPATATFAGAGELTADGRRVHPANWAGVGAGALFADGTRIRPAAAAFAGSGRMQASARLDKPGVNLSLWAVLPSNVLAPLPAFETLELSRERNGVGSVRVDYPAAGAGFGYLRAAVSEDRPVEVEMWLGGKRENPLRARLTQTEGDDLDGRSVWTFTGGFLEGDLADGVVYPQPLPAEKGELRFDAKNAGQVILTVLQQAQARGALAGITRDWTTSLDSSGQAWPNTISGLKFSPKTTLLAVLQDLVDKDFLEFEVTADRVLRVWAPDRRGTDQTGGAAPTLFRYGRVSSSPLRHSTRDTITAVLAIGADGLSATATDATAEARVGRRIEGSVDAGNIDNQAALQAYANAALAAFTKGQEEIRHPLTFGPGDPRPKAGYDLADKVLSERAGGSRRAVDVQQWTLTAARQRVTGGEVVLNDLIASRLQRLARALERIGSGGAVIGTSEPPVDDTLAPAAPTGVTATSDAYQDGADTYAVVIVGWAPVTTNSDASAADDIAGYRVQWREETAGVTGWQLGVDVPGGATSGSWGGVGAGIDIRIRVAAYDRDGNQGAWSSEYILTTETDATAPPVPSTPTVTPYLGQLKVAWNGLGSAGEVMPFDLDFVEVHRSTASAFTPTGATLVDAFSTIAGERVLTDLPYGVGQFVRLVAVDRTGNRSGPSAQGSATPEQVVSADVFDGAIGSAKLADLAVVTAKIDNLAVNDAKFGSGSVGKLTAGTLSVAVTNAGIIRSGTTGQRYELDAAALRLYNSAGTQTVQLNGAFNWMMGEIRTALSGQRFVLNPGGTNPSSMRGYPTAGSTFAEIRVATINGRATLEMYADRVDRSGFLGLYQTEAFVKWGDDGATPSRSAVSCAEGFTTYWGPSMALEIRGDFPNDGGARRIELRARNSSGNIIGTSTLQYRSNSAGEAQLINPFNDVCINFAGAGTDLYVGNEAGNAVRVTALDFNALSGRTAKKGERPIMFGQRTALDVVDAVESRSWNYDWEPTTSPGKGRRVTSREARRDARGQHVRDAAGKVQYDLTEVVVPGKPAVSPHFFPIAEELWAVAPELVTEVAEMPGGFTVGVRDTLGVLWQAVRLLSAKQKADLAELRADLVELRADLDELRGPLPGPART